MTRIVITPDARDESIWSHLAQVNQDAGQDAQQAPQSTAYDSLWAAQGVPTQEPSGIETFLLKEDKLYTVLAVVLIIWFGIITFMVRTDRKLARLEKSERSA